MKLKTKIRIQESFPFSENLLVVEAVSEDRSFTIFGSSANAETEQFEVLIGTHDSHVVVSLDDLIESLQYAKRALAENWLSYQSEKEVPE